MSRDGEEYELTDPGPARPAADSASKKPRPAASDLGESTFRPNPPRAKAAGKPSGSKTPGPYDRPEKFEVPVGGPSWWERIMFGRISSGQLSQFCRQFSAYLNAGVDITRALSSLEKQNSGTPSARSCRGSWSISAAARRFEEAMAREPQAFGPMFLNMIKVAEARGGVPETLKMLAQHFEARQRLIRQARSAMIYPAIVIILASGVVALITVVLLPMFASLLADISKKSVLPLPSRILMGFSHFVQSGGWWIIPSVLIGTPFVLFRIYKTESGKAIMDRIVLMVPVFGSLCRKIDTTRFARTLSVLLNAGVDVGHSIDLTADVLMMSPIQARRSRLPGANHQWQRVELNARLIPPILPGCHRRDRFRRRDRKDAGESRPPRRRLRGTSLDHRREPRSTRPATPDRVRRLDRLFHHSGGLPALHPNDHQPGWRRLSQLFPDWYRTSINAVARPFSTAAVPASFLGVVPFEVGQLNR